MIYKNTLISNKLQSPMQILQSQTTRTQLPMSNVARTQHGLGSEQLRVTSKNEQLPTHDLHIGQNVMYLNPVNRRWYSATITSLCQEPRSYKIRTEDGIIYRKTQSHLKPYQQQHNEDKVNNWNTWTLRFDLKQSNNNKKQNRPKCNVKPLVKLNLHRKCNTEKLASWPPNFKSYTKSVSFVEIKPVNVQLYASTWHVSWRNISCCNVSNKL